MTHRATFKPVVAVSAVVLLGSSAAVSAEPPQVYDGMTPSQLVAFAEREGWRAEASETCTSVVIRVGDKRVELISR